MSRARWQYASIKTKGIKLVPLHFLKDEQGTVHTKCFTKKRIKPIHNFRPLSFSWGFWQCRSYLLMGKWCFEFDEQRKTGRYHCFCEGGKPVSFICPPPGNNEKLMAWQKSYFTREQRSSVKKAISLTSYFYLTTFNVQGGEKGYFRRSYSASGCWHCWK